MAEKVYKRVVSSDPDLLPELEEFVIQIAKEVNLDSTKINNLALSFSEAISNCMKHGNRFDKSKTVTIVVTVSELKLTIMLKDEGKGFDINSVPDPTKPENILKDSGRGIHIMKNFVDDLRYNFTPQGTEIILEISLR
ncbi:MAG: anti-sigma regulatory factor serine/threonine protein kinase [Ignavibacteria bacterium]|nr:MAG: anti-sigma regulatory factor serine/threonine protein kinase [Ignavibacteria bacterium]KAF0161713.1 MAG: anti-sigma regulatory factor serine/threonine protein kinase [Ignavibacteria bacterium]